MPTLARKRSKSIASTPSKKGRTGRSSAITPAQSIEFWIVNGVPYSSEYSAQFAARQAAQLTRERVTIAVVQVPPSTARRLTAATIEVTPVDNQHAGPQRYIVVDGGQVVASVESAEEAIDFKEDRQNAVIYGRLSNSKDCGNVSNLEEPNRVANCTYRLSRRVLNRLRGVIDKKVCGHVELSPNSGHVDDNSSDDPFSVVHRRATNLECAEVTLRLHLLGWLDVRANMPQAVAALLTMHSRKLADAAKAVAAIKDTRKLDLVRDLIEKEGFLDSLAEQGKRIDVMGKVVNTPDKSIPGIDSLVSERFRELFHEFDAEIGFRVKSVGYAVVDPQSIMHPTKTLVKAKSFAEGRGRDSVVVGLVDIVKERGED